MSNNSKETRDTLSKDGEIKQDKGIPESEYMEAIKKAGSEAILECIPDADLSDFNFSHMYDTYYDTNGKYLDRSDYDTEKDFDEAKMDGFKEEIKDFLDDYLSNEGVEQKYRAEANLYYASSSPEYTDFTDKDGQDYRLYKEENGEFMLGAYDPDYTKGMHIGNSDWVYINIGEYNEALSYLKTELFGNKKGPKTNELTEIINSLSENGATIITDNSEVRFNEGKFAASVSDNGNIVVVEVDAMGRGSSHEFDADSVREIRNRSTDTTVYQKNEPQRIIPDMTVDTGQTR